MIKLNLLREKSTGGGGDLHASHVPADVREVIGLKRESSLKIILVSVFTTFLLITRVIMILSKTSMGDLNVWNFLKKIVRQRVWLTNFEYTDKKFCFQGVALTDSDLADLIQSLDKKQKSCGSPPIEGNNVNSEDIILRDFDLIPVIEGTKRIQQNALHWK
jgi:hypothetical protein